MRCVVPSCENDPNIPRGKRVTFFKFPTEPSLHAAWLEAMRKAFLQPKDCGIVCANHFSSKDLLDKGSGMLELRAGAVPIVDIQMCRICFSTNKKLYQMTAYRKLYEAYESLTGLLVQTVDKLPPYLCTECSNRVLNSACFRTKSVHAYWKLFELVQHDSLSLESIQSSNKLRNPIGLDTLDSFSDCSDFNIELLEKDDKLLTDKRDDAKKVSDLCEDNIVDKDNMKVGGEIQHDIVRKAQENAVRSHKDLTNNRGKVSSKSSSRSCSHQKKNAGHDSYATKKKVIKDIAVKKGACNSASVGTSNIHQGVTINRNKTEKEKAVVLNGCGNVDSSVVTPTSCHSFVVARIKFENDDFDQDIYNVDTYLNNVTPNSYHAIFDGTVKSKKDQFQQDIVLDVDTFTKETGVTCNSYQGCVNDFVKPERDPVEQGVLDVSALTANNAPGYLTPIKPVTVSHERRDQSIGIEENTRDVGPVIEDNEECPLYLVVREGTSEVNCVPISSLGSDTAIDGETEIDEEIKHCIALEEGAGYVDNDLSPSHRKTAKTSCSNGIYQDNDEDIGKNNTSNVGIASRSNNKIDFTFENESCDETEHKFLLVTGDAISKVDSFRASEETKEATAVPEQFDRSQTDADQQFIDDYGLTGEKFSCEICHYKTGNDICMLAHLKAHAATKHYNCETCNYKTTSNHSMKIHLLTHSGKKAYRCKVCDRLFARKSHLKNHKLQHSDEKPFMCNICKSVYSTNSSLRTHMLTHSNVNAYSCRMCEKKFTRKEHFKEHLKVHTGDRPHRCVVCTKSFRRKDDLENHMLSHSGNRPYKCENCDKSYSHKRNLQEHLKVHSSVKRYSCKVCDKSFLHKHSLKSHLRTHSSEKPYSCDICGKSFARRDYLQVHKGTCEHKNVDRISKEYSCKICNEVFGVKRHLRKHMLVHSGKKLYKCELCHKEFRRSASLQNHLHLHSNPTTDPISESQAQEPPQTV